jgi:hypothetical protein
MASSDSTVAGRCAGRVIFRNADVGLKSSYSDIAQLKIATFNARLGTAKFRQS